jgi:long-chain acyl-CoA synthetase
MSTKMNSKLTLSHNNIADFLEQSMLRHKEKPAFSCLGKTLTFAEIDSKSRALACYLQQHTNLQPGDRVAIQLPNIHQFPIAAYAVLRAGMIIVNTNPLYTPREMQHQFSDSGAKAIILLEDLLPKLDAIKASTSIETVIASATTDILTGDCTAIDGTIPFNQAIATGQSLALQPRQKTSVNSNCLLQYTGGTTGVSKGACLSHNNLLTNALQVIDRLGKHCATEKEILVCPLPLYHIYAFTVHLITFFSQGHLNILIPNPRDMDAFVAAIKPYKFTCFTGINTLFVGLCQYHDFQQLDFSHLKVTSSGGTALSGAAVKAWRKVTGCDICEGYGLSETSPVLCSNEPTNLQVGTVGLPVIGTEIEIWDEQDNPVKQGQEGQIVARGGQIMLGYWQQPEETVKVMTSSGWFKTGDIGIQLANGYIKIVDRLKDLIIVSGFNVYPNEVEEVLTSHPSVLEAAVLGEASEKTGEQVIAYITQCGELNTLQLIDYCKTQLTAYKLPKKIVIVDELPKSSVGKILRRELRTPAKV